MGKRYYKMIDLSKDLEGYMRTVKEIDKQIEKEQDAEAIFRAVLDFNGYNIMYQAIETSVL